MENKKCIFCGNTKSDLNYYELKNEDFICINCIEQYFELMKKAFIQKIKTMSRNDIENYLNNVMEVKKMDYPIDINNPWYHGSPIIMDTLKEGSTITQWKELALAFSQKPSLLSYDKVLGNISHNGTEKGTLYIIDEPILIDTDIYQHPRTTMDKGVEFLTKRVLKLKKIMEI